MNEDLRALTDAELCDFIAQCQAAENVLARRRLAAVALYDERQAWKSDGKPVIPWFVLFFAGVFVANFLRPLIGRAPGAGVGGLGGGALAYWLTSSIGTALGLGTGILFFALFLGFGGGSGGGRGARVFRDWGGGFGGGRGGGFSGGGGSFGGGGASARW